MHLKLIAFGRLKTPGLREAADHFSKMLKPWAKLEEIELKPAPLEGKDPAQRALAQKQDASTLTAALERHFSPRGSLWLLDEQGRSLPTLQWAQRIKKEQDQAASELVLVIGAAMGFAEPIRKQARAILSLGPQTLSHELARVVLFEQIYRAYSVLRGHPYHHEGA